MTREKGASASLSALLLIGALAGCATTQDKPPEGAALQGRSEPKASVIPQPAAPAQKEVPALAAAPDPAPALQKHEEPKDAASLENAFIRNFKMFIKIVAYASESAYAADGSDPKAQDELFAAAIRAYLHKLDPHSDYLPPDEYKAMQERKDGKYGGLGVEVEEDAETGTARVIAPFDGSPAHRAGIKPGDRIIGVDGKIVETYGETLEKMRGEPGEPIRLSVYRHGEKKPLEFNMIREAIEIKPIKTALIGNIAYLKLSTFGQKGVSEKKAKAAIRAMQAENPDIKGYVIDVRNNPGGFVDEGEKFSDLFLDEGTVVAQKDREGKITKSYTAKRGDVTGGAPIVVLINGGSASASEIFAGAMKGNHRAVILGEDSFGKGSVQTIYSLTGLFGDASYGGAFKITTALFFVPDGKGGLISIQGKGITPDIVYQPPRNEAQQGLLEARKEANLAGMIRNPDGDRPEGSAAKSFCSAAAGADKDAAYLPKPIIGDDNKVDYALLCAVKALDAQSDIARLTVFTPGTLPLPPTASREFGLN